VHLNRFFFILITMIICSRAFSDTTTDRVIRIYMDNRLPVDNTADNPGYTIGNRWYSGHSVEIYTAAASGVFGTKDFLFNNALIKYNIKSVNRWQISFRTQYFGFPVGLYSGNMGIYDFAVLGGVEVLYKVFGRDEGVYWFTDVGGGYNNFALYTGFGIGNRMKDNILIYFGIIPLSYVHLFLEFQKLLFEFFIIKVNTELFIDVKKIDELIFSTMIGGWIGFLVFRRFKIDLGGGVAFNERFYPGGFGGVVLSVKIY